MRTAEKLLITIALFTLSLPTYAQEPTDVDMLALTINLSKPVNFNDTEGNNLLVPEGEYWVLPGENSLMLVGSEDYASYVIAASQEEPDEEATESMATSVTGDEDEPDIHFIFHTSTNGEQLVAEGSYSGIRSRGWREKARAAKAAAARKARERALARARQIQAAKDRAIRQAALAAQAIIDKAKMFSPEQAMDRAEFLLTDVASTAIKHGPEAAKNKARTYAPELAILSVRSIPPGQKAQLIKQAVGYVSNNRVFIREVFDRIGRSPTIRNHIAERKGLNFTPAELNQISLDIMGEGDSALQLPFVKTRGAADFTGPSIGVGASVGGSGGIGGGLGVMNAISLTGGYNRSFEFDPKYCPWWHGTVTVGPKAEADVSVELGFFQGAADDLAGVTVPVSVSFKYFAGGGVSVAFGARRSETGTKWIPKIAGIVFSIGGGVGGGGSIGINAAVTSGCFSREGVTNSPLGG